MSGPLGISFASQIKSYAPGLYKALTPVANFYANQAGYRQVGLKYDDLIMEEREDVQKAISRLPVREQYDRAFRLRVAIQQSILHKDLPKDQQIKAGEDTQYLAPIVQEVLNEDAERAFYDNSVVSKK